MMAGKGLRVVSHRQLFFIDNSKLSNRKPWQEQQQNCSINLGKFDRLNHQWWCPSEIGIS